MFGVCVRINLRILAHATITIPQLRLEKMVQASLHDPARDAGRVITERVIPYTRQGAPRIPKARIITSLSTTRRSAAIKTIGCFTRVRRQGETLVSPTALSS